MSNCTASQLNGTAPRANCTAAPPPTPPTPPPGYWMPTPTFHPPPGFDNATNRSYCYDVPAWRDDLGDSCATYVLNRWCGRGFNADKACCACGGGLRDGPLAPVPFLARVHPNCSDAPSNWTDSLGYECKHYAGGIYAGDGAFRPYLCGGLGRRFAYDVGWHPGNRSGSAPRSAMQACCACGGGGVPVALVYVPPPPYDHCARAPTLLLGGSGGLLACQATAVVLVALALACSGGCAARRWRRQRQQGAEKAWDAKLAEYKVQDNASHSGGGGGGGGGGGASSSSPRLFARKDGRVVPVAPVSVLIDGVTGRHAAVDAAWQRFTPAWRGRAFFVHGGTGEFAFAPPPGYQAYQVWLGQLKVAEVRGEARLFKEHREAEEGRRPGLRERAAAALVEMWFQLQGCRWCKRRRRRKLHPHQPAPLKELRVLSAETNKSLPAPAWA